MKFLLPFVFAALSGLDLRAAPKEPPTPPPPPMAQPQNVSIYRGHSIEIPLRAIGRAPSQLKFLVRAAPKHGTLGEIQVTGEKTAVVTYTHDERSADGHDSFSFAVKAFDGPVSAAGPINITISEEPPALSVVHDADFGKHWLGEPHEEQIIIRNAGGGILQGTMDIRTPWKILGSKEYHLGRKQEQKVRLLFAPDEEGDFSERLAFSHDARTGVNVTGSGVAPFAYQPSGEIALRTQSSTTRSADLVIQNRTEDERTLSLSLPTGLTGPVELTLPAGGEQKVTLQAKPDQFQAIEGSVTIRSDDYRHQIPLHAYAVGPILQASPASLLFGSVPQRQPARSSFEIANRGGTDARLRVQAPEQVLLTPDPSSVVLSPGESRHFDATFEAVEAGSYKRDIAISAEGAAAISLPVTAEVTIPAKPAAGATIASTGPATESGAAIAAPKEEFSAIPPIDKVTLLTADPHTVEIGWKKPAADAVSYIVENRIIAIGNNGQPDSQWNAWRGAKFLERNGLVVARFENLQPGRAWFIRISSLDETDHRSQPSATIHISTSVPHANHLLYWSLAVFGIAAITFGIFLKRRQNQSADAEDAQRLARLDHRP